MIFPIFFYKSDVNHHGTQKKGERRNSETVTGPKFTWIKLERKSPGFSRRLIYYFPSGAWWRFDIFSKRKIEKFSVSRDARGRFAKRGAK